jgi:sensor histidine kinase regulating citrate/malate metabolism
MVLFENSINVSKKRKIKNLKINIEVLSIDNSIKIIFEDNAGGVEYKPINAIFEKNISSNSTGIGLYMAKYFLIKNLNGTINVKNGKSGAIFEISFNIK